jgi:RecA/RadA recombinase
MMSNFLTGLVKKIDDDYTSIADDEKGSGEFTGFIDTGSYALNALLSGSIYGGMPNNKVLAFAGEEATGKTFFTLGVVKHFLDQYPGSGCVYYDVEAAITKKMLVDRGIDPKRVIIAEPETLQQFRTHALKILEAYSEQDPLPRCSTVGAMSQPPMRL